MTKEEVLGILKSLVPDADIVLEGEDCNFTVRLISDQFADMKTIARQQLVLGGFTDQLRTGEIHALSVKAMTPAEFQASQQLTSISL